MGNLDTECSSNLTRLQTLHNDVQFSFVDLIKMILNITLLFIFLGLPKGALLTHKGTISTVCSAFVTLVSISSGIFSAIINL